MSNFISFSEKYGGSGRGPKTERDVRKTVALSTTKAGGNGRISLVFTIGKDVLKDVRWIEKDKIDVLFDGEMTFWLKRVKTGGWTLGCQKDVKNFMSIKISHREGMPIVEKITTMENVVIKDEGILCELPK
jgi:hypothetical protein